MINILHISDLHYTAEGEGLRRDYCQAAAKAILQLAGRLQGEGILGRSFGIALTGDLVQAGALEAMKRHKDRLRRHYSEIIGLNTYVGRRLKVAKKGK